METSDYLITFAAAEMLETARIGGASIPTSEFIESTLAAIHNINPKSNLDFLMEFFSAKISIKSGVVEIIEKAKIDGEEAVVVLLKYISVASESVDRLVLESIDTAAGLIQQNKDASISVFEFFFA